MKRVSTKLSPLCSNTAALTLMAAVVSNSAAGQEQCNSYVAKTVKPQKIETVIAKLAALSPKSEFETTSDYDERRRKAIGDNFNDIVISKPVEERATSIRYNADTKSIHISAVAFGYYIPNLDRKLRESGHATSVKTGYQNVSLLILNDDKPAGSYIGSNAFGAKTRVSRTTRLSAGIFDGPTGKANFNHPPNYVFPSAEASPFVAGTISADPAKAKELKATLQLAVTVTPTAPYIARGTHRVGEVTFDSPEDITEQFSILFADLKCALVLDKNNLVIAAFATK